MDTKLRLSRQSIREHAAAFTEKGVKTDGGILRFDRIRNMFLEQIEARGSFRLGKEMTVELEGNINRR